MFKKIFYCVVITAHTMQSSDVVLIINQPTVQTPLLAHKNFTEKFIHYKTGLENNVTESMHEILPLAITKTIILEYVISKEQELYDTIQGLKKTHTMISKCHRRESLMLGSFTIMQFTNFCLGLISGTSGPDGRISNSLAIDTPPCMWPLFGASIAAACWNLYKFRDYITLGDNRQEIIQNVRTLKPFDYVPRFYGSFTTNSLLFGLIGIFKNDEVMKIFSIISPLVYISTDGSLTYENFKHLRATSEELAQEIAKLEATLFQLS